MQSKNNRKRKSGLGYIIAASSAGTVIEWYDFFIFGSLATIISKEFFPAGNPAAAFLATLATFSAGLIIRPLGALFFGRLGDKKGRKYTFMVTLGIMGFSTIAIGLVPGYEKIGFLAPLIVLLLRLLQGLALGGEYGGAAVYVAEHAPEHKRGFFTSWIQTTSGLAFILSIAVILFFKSLMPADTWLQWGWRLPFIASVVLIGVSMYIRSQLSESPLFAQAKAEGNISRKPIRETFGSKANLKIVLLAFLGLTFGGGAIGWITFYAQSFMLKTLILDFNQANEAIIVGILAGLPFFPIFGWLSDKTGRKKIMIAGMLLGVLAFRPVFDGLYQTVKKYETMQYEQMISDQRSDTSFVNASDYNIVHELHFKNGAEVKKTESFFLSGDAVHRTVETVSIKVSSGDLWKLVSLIFVLQFIFTVAYGPLAAYMVELFPLRIRYTSISFPYHFGFGIFGGLAPYFATYFVEKSHVRGVADFYLAGLNYPIILTAISVIIGTLYLKESPKMSGGSFAGHPILKHLRKWSGIVWILFALFIFWFGVFDIGLPRIISGLQEDVIFGIIITFLITPVLAIGLFIFGFYALRGEYD